MAENLIESYRQFRGFIYDLDDTLLDNSGGPEGIPLHAVSKLEAYNRAANTFNLELLGEVTLEQEVATFRRASEHTLLAGLRELMRDIYPDMSDELLLEVYDYIRAEKKSLHLGVIREFGKPIKGAVEIVRLLAARGYGDKQAIASGAHREEIEYFLDRFGMARYFSPTRIVGHEDITKPKPDPESMLLAAASIKSLSGDIRPLLVFEDDPKGIKAARLAGMWVVGLSTRYIDEALMDAEYKPDIVVPDIVSAFMYLGLPLPK